MDEEEKKRRDDPMNDENELVTRARSGDRAALEELVKRCKDLVYNLAIRMLGDRGDAEDVSQEILIRVVTGLASFRGESSFRTWVYRVASNHLLTARKRKAEEKMQSFEALSGYLDVAIAADLPPLEDQVLVSEARLRCTTSMLLCLDRDHRLAFILGEILELSSEDGAEALEISSDAFRKRLSRARERMGEFMKGKCGLVETKNPCRCATQATSAARDGRLNAELVQLATHPNHRREERPPIERVEAIERGDRRVPDAPQLRVGRVAVRRTARALGGCADNLRLHRSAAASSARGHRSPDASRAGDVGGGAARPSRPSSGTEAA